MLNNSFVGKQVCLPSHLINTNKYAFFFAITDSYSFAVANIIMQLNHHNPNLMKECDILIYSDDMSERNKQLLCQLHDNIVFLDISFPEMWHEIVEDPWLKSSGYSLHVFCKLYGFFLIDIYERVVWLDADILIRGDISELFHIDEPLAWRRVGRNTKPELEGFISDSNSDISVGNGGLICFSNKLNYYCSDYMKEIELWCRRIIDAPGGGHDEKIIACVAYNNYIPVKELYIYITRKFIK